jgi:hypothetical protein
MPGDLISVEPERRPDGVSAREGYDSGWEPVIGRFAETAARVH